MSQIDRKRARDAFAAYVKPYDIKNPRIALKVKHTYKVAAIGERIARAEGLDPDEVDLAWLCCLLHDIGRFEQLRRWNTFRDGRSVSHAALGVDTLFGTAGTAAALARPVAPELPDQLPAPHPADPQALGSGRIDSFVDDRSNDELIRTAIAFHSDLEVPDGLDARTCFFCDLVRDADKIDIFRASGYENSPETVMGVSRASFLDSEISPDAEDAFFEHRCLTRDERHTPLDTQVGTVAMVYELVFSESYRIAREQGFIYRDLDEPFGISEPLHRADARETWARMGEHLRDWLDAREA